MKDNIEKVHRFEKIEFSKKNTLALKGIAIIMMIFHHCFRKSSLFENFNVSFFPLGQDFVVEISAMFKICVSIFAFLTGYGLTVSLRKLNEKYNCSRKQIHNWTIERLIKTLSGYWIIVILSLVICQIINGKTYTVLFKNGIVYGIVNVILNFLGLSNLMGTPLFSGTWWYMSIAILFITTIPIFIKLFKKYGYFLILSLVIAIPRIIGWQWIENSYISFIFPVLLGIIFAENNLMVKIANLKLNKNTYINKIIKFIIETVVIILLYFIYNSLPTKLFYEIKYGVIPVCLICYLYEFFIDLPILRNILEFLGKHSMNIFLIHAFLRTDYLNEFIYSQGSFIKIGLVLLLISLALSIILELFKKLIRYDKIINKLINKLNLKTA